MRKRYARDGAIEIVRTHLEHSGAPRLQMTAVLILTAGTGFLVSVLMLHLGIRAMAMRYPIAVVLAYGAFLLFVRLWLAWFRRRDQRRDRISGFDASGLDLSPGGPGGGGSGPEFGGGGGFGGGGAGGSWGGSPTPEPIQVAAVAPRTGGGSGSADHGGWGFDLDFGEGAILLVPIVAALAAAFASLYVIYAAPSLLAELLVDGLVVTALYRRIRGVEHRNWLHGVLRRTWIPALLTATVFATAGYLMQRKYPTAPSIGPFWEAATRK